MNSNKYDQGGIPAKIHEIRTLYLYIVASAIVSLIVMNLLVFPLALFAVKMPALYSKMCPWIFSIMAALKCF